MLATLAASQHGVVTRRQAAGLGLSRRQVQHIACGPMVSEPVRGVLVFRASPDTWRRSLMVVTLCSPGFWAGYRAAAHLHGIDGFRTDPPVEIVGRRGARRVPVAGVRQHWVDSLDPDDVVIVDGIACTGLARTVVDVCGVVPGDVALRAVDDFERGRNSLNWLRQTAERLHRPGQSGTRTVLRLRDERQAGGRVPDSWFERLVERCVALPHLPPWARQHVVRDGARVVARLDLACPTLRLGVEAHSRAFHFGRTAESIDERRDNRLAALGWHLVYVGWYDTESPAAVARTIARIAAQRAAQAGWQLEVLSKRA